MADLTIVTVTYNTWETHTSRLIAQVFHYVDPSWYSQWIMVDNNSEDADKITAAMCRFPPEHRERFTLIRSDKNIGDLPQYNRIFERFVTTENIVGISTDMRIFRETIPWFNFLLEWYDLAGIPGYAIPKAVAADDDNPLHWIPRLLVERGLEFDHTAHIQTHAFCVRRSAFLEAGGFWEPEDENYLDKGNLITGEIMLSIKLRKLGKRILAVTLPMYHYGNQKSAQEMNDFDRARGWDLGFIKEEEDFEVFKLGGER